MNANCHHHEPTTANAGRASQVADPLTFEHRRRLMVRRDSSVSASATDEYDATPAARTQELSGSSYHGTPSAGCTPFAADQARVDEASEADCDESSPRAEPEACTKADECTVQEEAIPSTTNAAAFAQLLNWQLPPCLDALATLAHYSLFAFGPQVDPTSGHVVGRFTAPPTPFDSSAIPSLPLHDFVSRICQKTTYNAIGFAYGVCLLARWVRVTGSHITLLNVHRLVLVCIAVGVKTNCDFFLKNAFMARVGGVALGEFNELEARLLDDLHFSCHVTQEEMTALLSSFPHVLDIPWQQTNRPLRQSVAIAEAALTNAVPSIARFSIGARHAQ